MGGVLGNSRCQSNLEMGSSVYIGVFCSLRHSVTQSFVKYLFRLSSYDTANGRFIALEHFEV